jgi:lysophospholipase L1-like esterase
MSKQQKKVQSTNDAGLKAVEEKQDPMNWETLLCLGDSITFGARSYLGYPEMCGHILEERLDKQWNVVNHATNGFTTIDLVRSLNTHQVTYKQIFPSLITILIGTNDIKNSTSATDFTIAYRQLLVKAGLFAVNNNVVLIKIPHFTNKVFYPYHFDMNRTVSVFNDIIEDLAQEAGLRTFTLQLDDDDFFDGVHFNAKGSQNAAMQLAGFILKDKGIEDITSLSKNAIPSR